MRYEESVTYARDLPDGPQVRYEGEVYTALPVTEVAGAKIRWHAPTSLAGDRGMDAMLDDGAKVIGRDEQAVAEYRDLLKEAGR